MFLLEGMAARGGEVLTPTGAYCCSSFATASPSTMSLAPIMTCPLAFGPSHPLPQHKPLDITNDATSPYAQSSECGISMRSCRV